MGRLCPFGGRWPSGSHTRFPGEGKGSGRHLRTGGRPAGNEFGLRCLLGARILSQAQPPSSRCCVAALSTAPGRKTAGCKRPPPRCGPDHGGPDCSGQPARVWTVGRNLPRLEAMSTPRNVTKQAPSGQLTGHPAKDFPGPIEGLYGWDLQPNCYPSRTGSDQAKLPERRATSRSPPGWSGRRDHHRAGRGGHAGQHGQRAGPAQQAAAVASRVTADAPVTQLTVNYPG
jgi:hypothetical protein